MKKRVIPSILIGNGTSTVLSTKFDPWRTAGTLTQQLRLHISRQADELILLNPFTSLTGNGRISQLVNKEVDIPICYAGGISSLNDAEKCIQMGFERVYVSQLFHNNPNEISKIASVLGSQSVAVSLEYKWIKNKNNSYPVLWNYKSQMIIETSLCTAIIQAASLGAGEILLYNVDLDGSLSGLDKKLLRELDDLSIEIPILIAGGAGCDSDFSDVLIHPMISGVVAGSIFSLTETTPSTIRNHCKEMNIMMRDT